VQFRTPAADLSSGALQEPFGFGDARAVLNDRDFTLVRQLIAEYAGIKLTEQKRNMVYTRLLRRLRARGLGSFSAYLGLVQENGSIERESFVNALTTNLTAFFREPHHFELLGALAQRRADARLPPMRIWSSACSTGEEAWSIAMILREAGCAGEILATDIDTDVLQTASAGVYRSDRAGSLEPERLRKHFLRGAGAYEGWVTMRPELRAMVKFAQFNLQSPVWPAQDRFDAIFCRNVVIYFDRESQRRLVARFAELLRPGGVLIVGHSESFPAGHPAFRSCGRTAYERVAG
jgi:chemotaxis protein methyltransferase CheR